MSKKVTQYILGTVFIIVTLMLYLFTRPNFKFPQFGEKEYTMAEVGQHNNEASCWTVINDGIYDVTLFISLHPGGERAILGLCGKDGSERFNNKHGGVGYALEKLGTFTIGKLKK